MHHRARRASPGDEVRSHVVVKVPKNLAADLACKATNTAKIAEAAGGTDLNTDPTDDEAEATMILPGEVADCPELPPLSNLKLFKTGPDEKCPPDGDDWVCEFIIKVQNFGDALYERDPIPRCAAFRDASWRHDYVHGARRMVLRRTDFLECLPVQQRQSEPRLRRERRDRCQGQDSHCVRDQMRGHEQRA